MTQPVELIEIFGDDITPAEAAWYLSLRGRMAMTILRKDGLNNERAMD